MEGRREGGKEGRAKQRVIREKGRARESQGGRSVLRDGGRQEAARKEQKREGEKGEERERVKEGGWDGGIEGGDRKSTTSELQSR